MDREEDGQRGRWTERKMDREEDGQRDDTRLAWARHDRGGVRECAAVLSGTRATLGAAGTVTIRCCRHGKWSCRH
ncbi:MAG: hypothetical protein ACI3ZF_01855 [Candidatus Cryptobacteroides sp.]